jgi:hypothetical protein
MMCDVSEIAGWRGLLPISFLANSGSGVDNRTLSLNGQLALVHHGIIWLFQPVIQPSSSRQMYQALHPLATIVWPRLKPTPSVVSHRNVEMAAQILAADERHQVVDRCPNHSPSRPAPIDSPGWGATKETGAERGARRSLKAALNQAVEIVTIGMCNCKELVN